MSTYHCTRCGGTSIYYDAYVGVNDPTDVRTFDAVFCEDCETITGAESEEGE